MSKQIHENSRKSYNEQKEKNKTETFRFKIWDLLRKMGRPLTDREIMELLKEDDVNNIRPDITRLKQGGFIYECAKKKCPVTKKTVRTTSISGLPYKESSKGQLEFSDV